MFLLKFYSAPDQKFLVFLINPHRDPISWFSYLQGHVAGKQWS